MLRTTMGITSAAALLALTAGTASAQEYEGEQPYFNAAVPAPIRAFELGVNVGYAQGFGGLAGPGALLIAGRPLPNGNVSNVAGVGISNGLTIGYRANPNFRIGWTGQFQQFQAADQLGNNASARGVATSIDAAIHFNPYRRLDPWVSFGVGHRAIWAAPRGANNNVLIHGFQLGRVQTGVDVRPTRDVAVGPMIGADIDVFFWRNPEGVAGDLPIDNKRVSTFVYAGVQGTFDLGGSRQASPTVIYTTAGK